MGKREVRVIVIRKRITALLLVFVSAAMLSLIGFLSGKTYSSEARGPAEEVVTLMQFRSEPDGRLIASMMPLLADVIAFLPWGFLAFMALDRRGRTRFRSYLLTCAGAVSFALLLVLWQYFLATRVTTFGDTIFNFAGALTGASLGHLRRSVRIRFHRAMAVILIVEDDPHVARLIGLVLQRGGHHSEVVGDGNAAVERVRQLRPAMIVADLGIKGLSGEALCTTLKSDEETRGIPYVIVSGDRDLAEKARGCGADDYMGKPFEFDDLLRLVNKYATAQSGNTD